MVTFPMEKERGLQSLTNVNKGLYYYNNLGKMMEGGYREGG